MVVIRAVVLLLLMSLAAPQPARPSGTPAGTKPLAAGPQPLSGGAAIMPPGSSPTQEEPAATPMSPALEEALRSATESIRMNSSNQLGEQVDFANPQMTCLECNCTYGYTSQMPLGDVVYSINFLLSFVEAVKIAGSTVQIKSRNNTIVVTTDRKLVGDAVRDVRSYDSFEIYLYDREAAESVAQNLTTARDLCKK